MKKTGILLHISSLPNGYGIGNFGKAAFDFVDFLNLTNQKYWQILPLNPIGYGYSPYQSVSTFAINPLFIDLDALKQAGMLKATDLVSNKIKNTRDVDYPSVINFYNRALKKAFINGYESIKDKIDVFVNDNPWLYDYAHFMALKELNGDSVWQECVITLSKEEESRLHYHYFVQYIANKQYLELKEYANAKDIVIIGDIPIYVSEDSADVWSNPEEFYLDKQGFPTARAGVPPDYFSEEGQFWGNPLYNYKEMRKNNFYWWRQRLMRSLNLYDIVRIDHFRAFAAYWAVSGKTAREGKWVKSVGRELLSIMQDILSSERIIAEDLGIITPAVDRLRKEFGFFGMKVLQFAFATKNKRHKYLPHNYPEDCVAYSGTHDNDTLLSFINKGGKEIEHAKNYYKTCNSLLLCDIMLRSLVDSKAKIVIIPAQDILALDYGRMNTPATTEGNWTFRLLPEELEKRADYLINITKI